MNILWSKILDLQWKFLTTKTKHIYIIIFLLGIDKMDKFLKPSSSSKSNISETVKLSNTTINRTSNANISSKSKAWSKKQDVNFLPKKEAMQHLSDILEERPTSVLLIPFSQYKDEKKTSSKAYEA